MIKHETELCILEKHKPCPKMRIENLLILKRESATCFKSTGWLIENIAKFISSAFLDNLPRPYFQSSVRDRMISNMIGKFRENVFHKCRAKVVMKLIISIYFTYPFIQRKKISLRICIIFFCSRNTLYEKKIIIQSLFRHK